jgi:phosphate starvation-inducible protein PhoH and related proteins
MKMFLTRIGFGAKAVVTGDVSQIDLPRTTTSGLIDAARVLTGVEGIAFTRFTSADVVRHPLVARMVDAYDRQRQQEEDRASATAADATRSDGAAPRGGRARR